MLINTEISTSNTITHTSVSRGHTETAQINWSDADIQELQYHLILVSLNDLKDKRKSTLMRSESLHWIMIDEPSNPLSFDNCCVALSMNMETIRSFVRLSLTREAVC